MKSLVIGGAGFIGSHLVDRLVSRGPVTVIDNLSSGRREFINPRATLIKCDAVSGFYLDPPGHFDICFHLAANPDARHALTMTRTDLDQGTVATYNALEACRVAGVKRFFFASSGTVYGNTSKLCAEGDLGNLPISLYGASKLSGEAMVSAFCECFGLEGYICRFGNVVGSRATHGCIVDFLKQLKETGRLVVSGDGSQRKPYLHVSDCVDAILNVIDHAEGNPAVYNVAPVSSTTVRDIASCCAKDRPIEYGTGGKGWPGDVGESHLSNAKLLAEIGWSTKMTSDHAVQLAIEELRS